jgi:hypothetical protein
MYRIYRLTTSYLIQTQLASYRIKIQVCKTFLLQYEYIKGYGSLPLPCSFCFQQKKETASPPYEHEDDYRLVPVVPHQIVLMFLTSTSTRIRGLGVIGCSVVQLDSSCRLTARVHALDGSLVLVCRQSPIMHNSNEFLKGLEYILT